VNWRASARRLLPYLISATGGFLIAYLVVAFAIFPADIIPAEAEVPNVVGLQFDVASERLRLAGFRISRGESRFTADAPRNNVLQQMPAAGSKELKGTTVVVDLSSGQRFVDVPAVVGMTRREAEIAVENAGLDVGNVTERESQIPRGQVIASDPNAGSRITSPGTVHLVLSAGPSTVQLPDLVGRPYPQARAMLEQLGLRPGAVTIDSSAFEPANTVVGQDPEPGRTVPGGSTVNFRISGRTR
jgi:serine/threonine-protein kinase